MSRYNETTLALEPNLFGREKALVARAVPELVGQFFELVFRRMVRRRLTKNSELNLPDFSVEGYGAEVKASCTKFVVAEEQLRAFERSQNETFETVYYFLFLYKPDDSCLACGTSQAMFRNIARNVEACIVVPSDVVTRLAANGMNRSEYRGWGDRTGGYYRLCANAIFGAGVRRIKSVKVDVGGLETNRFSLYTTKESIFDATFL